MITITYSMPKFDKGPFIARFDTQDEAKEFMAAPENQNILILDIDFEG